MLSELLCESQELEIIFRTISPELHQKSNHYSNLWNLDPESGFSWVLVWFWQ